MFGDAHILKLFRRLSPGVNPDLEVNLALTRRGCAHVPAVHGWIELEPGRDGAGDEPTTLALLSEYLRGATDGWRLALTSVRDWLAQPTLPGAPPPPSPRRATRAPPAATSPPRRSGSARPPPRCTAISPPRSA